MLRRRKEGFRGGVRRPHRDSFMCVRVCASDNPSNTIHTTDPARTAARRPPSRGGRRPFTRIRAAASRRAAETTISASTWARRSRPPPCGRRAGYEPVPRRRRAFGAHLGLGHRRRGAAPSRPWRSFCSVLRGEAAAERCTGAAAGRAGRRSSGAPSASAAAPAAARRACRAARGRSGLGRASTKRRMRRGAAARAGRSFHRLLRARRSALRVSSPACTEWSDGG